MPQFKVAKTNDKTKLNNNAITEDKLYIYKETDKFGRLFYDFSNGTRIEIGSLDNVYTTQENLVQDTEILDCKYLLKYSANDKFSTVDINEVQINSFLISDVSIYNIREINRQTGAIVLRKLYTQEPLKWNDYYE